MTDPYGDMGELDITAEHVEVPQPPPRGTRAWRRMVLEICAVEDYDDYHEALLPLWQWRGWRLGVDVMTETLCALARCLPAGHGLRGAFGQVRLDRILALYTEEERLAHALELSQEYAGQKPAHEILAENVASAQRFGAMLTAAVPVWQDAAAAMRAPDYDQGAGAAVLIRHLNATGTRSASAATMSMLLHGTLRFYAFPRGSAWIDRFLDRDLAPEVASSQAVYAAGDDFVAAEQMDRLSAAWVRNGRPGERRTAKARRGTRSTGCQRCGSPHHRR